MTAGRMGLCFLLICVGCSGTPLTPSARMWVATQPQSIQLQAAQTECDQAAQRSSGTIDTTLSIWIDEAAFERCMEHDGWALESIRGVSPASHVKSHVNVRSGPSPNDRVTAQLSRGARAGFLTEIEGWYQVRLDDGREGFVSSRWTELVGSTR